MAIAELQEKYIPRDNGFYQRYYHYFIIALLTLIFLLLAAIGFVLYQINNRPLPTFTATQPDGAKLNLTTFDQPNLLPDTILRFATKAATASYNFNFGDYAAKIADTRQYFTEAGWAAYNAAIQRVVNEVVSKQLIVSSVVYGPPVIANQGDLPDIGYAWRVQIPFLVTYTTGTGQTSKRKYYVVLMIVPVSTSTNPQAIGVEQFFMV